MLLTVREVAELTGRERTYPFDTAMETPSGCPIRTVKDRLIVSYETQISFGEYWTCTLPERVHKSWTHLPGLGTGKPG